MKLFFNKSIYCLPDYPAEILQGIVDETIDWEHARVTTNITAVSLLDGSELWEITKKR